MNENYETKSITLLNQPWYSYFQFGKRFSFLSPQFSQKASKQTKAPKKKKKTQIIKTSITPFLASGVPNLGLDNLAVHIQAPGGELDADGGLGFQAELVASEPGEQVGLAHAGVPDQHHLEEVVIVVLSFVPSHSSNPNNTTFASDKQREIRVLCISLSLYFLSLTICCVSLFFFFNTFLVLWVRNENGRCLLGWTRKEERDVSCLKSESFWEG